MPKYRKGDVMIYIGLGRPSARWCVLNNTDRIGRVSARLLWVEDKVLGGKVGDTVTGSFDSHEEFWLIEDSLESWVREVRKAYGKV